MCPNSHFNTAFIPRLSAGDSTRRCNRKHIRHRKSALAPVGGTILRPAVATRNRLPHRNGSLNKNDRSGAMDFSIDDRRSMRWPRTEAAVASALPKTVHPLQFSDVLLRRPPECIPAQTSLRIEARAKRAHTVFGSWHRSIRHSPVRTRQNPQPAKRGRTRFRIPCVWRQDRSCGLDTVGNPSQPCGRRCRLILLVLPS